MNNLFIGKNIRKIRMLRGMSQAQLADKIGVTWEMISRYERGLSSPHKKLNAIAGALGVSVSQLFQKDFESSLMLNDSSKVDYGASIAVVPEVDLEGLSVSDLENIDNFEDFITRFGVVSTVVIGKNLLKNRKEVFVSKIDQDLGIFVWGQDPSILINNYPRYLQLNRSGVKLVKEPNKNSKILGSLIGLISL